MYCRNCGQNIDDNADVCIHCGVATHKQEVAQSNTLAIVGLIFAFIIPIVGLICSILGKKKAAEMGGKGKGLAIAGIVVSIIEMIAIVLYIVIAIALIGAAAGAMVA